MIQDQLLICIWTQKFFLLLFLPQQSLFLPLRGLVRTAWTPEPAEPAGAEKLPPELIICVLIESISSLELLPPALEGATCTTRYVTVPGGPAKLNKQALTPCRVLIYVTSKYLVLIISLYCFLK